MHSDLTTLLHVLIFLHREIVSAHPNHLGVAIRTVIQNELSTARNPGNMTLLVMMIGANQDLSAKVRYLNFIMIFMTVVF